MPSLYELHRLLPLAGHLAAWFFWAVAVCLIPVVLVRRKEPSSTIAWILTLVFLPALGTILFLLFGRDRIRMPAKRKRALDAIVRAQVAASRDEGAGAVPPLGPTSSLERDLFRVGARLTNLRATAGNRVDALFDGNATYDAIGAAIDAAQHHVHAQYYLIRNDATGAWFRERLIAAAKRGVTVRLLLDGYGCLAIGSR